MPPDLPGFYWDVEKNRYFPLSARRAGSAGGIQPSTPVKTTVHESHTDSQHRPLKKRRTLYDLDVRGSLKSYAYQSFAQRDRMKQQVLETHLTTATCGEIVYTGAHSITAFNVSHDGEKNSVRLTTGDTAGYLQTFELASHGQLAAPLREVYVGSELTAMCCSDQFRIVTSAGNKRQLAVNAAVQHEDSCWAVMDLSPKLCHDIRAADLRGSCLALGAASRAIIFTDMNTSWNPTFLPTGSDVLSICQSENILYTGLRNGSIKAFDKRLNPSVGGQEKFNGKFRADTSSITHLSVINEWQLLVSTIRGDLELFDLRFAGKTEPCMHFEGHVNSWSTKLGVATSPCQSLLFAAGQDRRIRAWSLRTGDLIKPRYPQGINIPEFAIKPLDYTFAGPIAELQVVEGGFGVDAGLSLWAASGKDIYRFGIGRTL